MVKGELKSAEGLRTKLKNLFEKSSKLNWDTVAQGDLMFLKQDIKEMEHDGEQYMLF